MGVTASTSLARLRDNPTLLRFVGEKTVAENDVFWKELLSFSYVPPRNPVEGKLLEEATAPLVEALVKHNPQTGNLRVLVRTMLELAASLRDESKCESNLATWQVHNALLILRVSLKYILQNMSEEEAILQLDGSTTIPRLTSLESTTKEEEVEIVKTKPANSLDPLALLVQEVVVVPDLDSVAQTSTERLGETGKNMLLSSSGGNLNSLAASVNPAELASITTLLSRQLVEGLVALLVEVPLLPFTYDVHLEAISLFQVLLSSQMYGGSSSGSVLLQHIMAVPRTRREGRAEPFSSTSSDLANLLVHCLLQHFVTQPPLPPQHFRTHSTGIISSIASGLWWLVTPSSSSASNEKEHPSPLAQQSLLLLLVLSHQQTQGDNFFRSALFSFSDDHGDKSPSSFSLSLEKLYLSLCHQLINEQTTLFLYLLLQGNSNVASFIFSRSDIDLLVVPLLKQLHDCGSQSSHHVYMLLIIVLILSQDECFNKSIHEVQLPRVVWYTERSVSNISLGSIMVMVLVRTIQVNIAQIRDKYLHTNCLAALANMSAHFRSLHLDAAQKLVNLFKLLAKKHQRIGAKLKNPTPLPSNGDTSSNSHYSDYATDQSIVEEILQMVLEITNSCLTHNLHNNPHLVYSLLYQREAFEPYRTFPSLMDLVQNIETVIAFFSTQLEKSGPSPYSSASVLETIVKASKSWPRNRLRVFPELRFRYVEEDQPEEFFIPYVWTLVFKSSSLHWDNSRIQFSTT